MLRSKQVINIIFFYFIDKIKVDYRRSFEYYPFKFRQVNNDNFVEGFMFPANGFEYDSKNAADFHNLRLLQS